VLGVLTDVGALDFIAEVLEYVSAIRAVAGYLGSCVLFRCDATLSDSAIRAACEVRDRIKRLRVFGPEVCPVKLTLTASGDNVRSILTPKVAALRVESERHELRAFGQALILPRGRIDIINFQARPATTSTSTLTRMGMTCRSSLKIDDQMIEPRLRTCVTR
jgi:hypothetical protein